MIDSQLDVERLRLLADLGDRRGTDLLAEILTRFEGSRTAHLAAEASAAGDVENATLHLHSLKGSAANLGARTLAGLAAALEQAVRKGETFAGLEPRFAELNAAHAQTLVDIKAFATQHRQPQGNE
jgi:HPt (histidine-containing phosphotransfer) domain-containing protein